MTKEIMDSFYGFKMMALREICLQILGQLQNLKQLSSLCDGCHCVIAINNMTYGSFESL